MTPLYPPTRPLPISQVLDASFRIFKVTFVRCLAFGPLWIIVGQLPQIYHLAIGKPVLSSGLDDPISFTFSVLGFLGSLAISAALVLHQRDIASGVPTRMLAQLLAGVRRLPAIVGTTLLSAIIIGVPTAILLWPVLIKLITRTLFTNDAMITSLGLIAVLYVSYAGLFITVAWSALLLDGLSPIASLRSAFRLVTGNWWRTFVVLLVAFFVTLVIYFAAATVLLPLISTMDVVFMTVASQMLFVILSALAVPYFGATMLALYGDLKARKEGTDLEQRISAART